MTQTITAFDYGQLDAPTADFLRMKERNMREIVSKAYTELGHELKEAQDALARQGSKYEGVFERWYAALGWKKRTVYNLIDRFNLVHNLHEVERMRIEDLPVSLSYEIAAPSADSTEPKRQAKTAVLNGDIKTLKEYRELVAKLEEAELSAKRAEESAASERQAREEAESQADSLRDTIESIREQPPRVEVEYVRDTADSDRLKRYEERFATRHDEEI